MSVLLAESASEWLDRDALEPLALGPGPSPTPPTRRARSCRCGVFVPSVVERVEHQEGLWRSVVAVLRPARLNPAS